MWLGTLETVPELKMSPLISQARQSDVTFGANSSCSGDCLTPLSQLYVASDKNVC